MSAIPDQLAREVLIRYSTAFKAARVTALGNRGGFSGAGLWRIEAGGHSLCLRAWPAQLSGIDRLSFIHGLMNHARSYGLTFVPGVIATADGRSHVEHGDRQWDLTEWLPGQSDFRDRPSQARLEAASVSLAQLHIAWEKFAPNATEVCPALHRRIAAAAEWKELRRSGWRPPQSVGKPVPIQPLAERACFLLDRLTPSVEVRLRPWLNRRWSLQACHCDTWHDNLLFKGDRLTGLIDYAAAKIDHPATDIARMLGSLVPDQPVAWQIALNAYRSERPLRDDEEKLAHALDETGSVIAAATWLRWLYEENRQFEDGAAVSRRIGALVERMEQRGLCDTGK
jgi:Ser/Thr protein kinase RdoA (MazF antagonist)